MAGPILVRDSRAGGASSLRLRLRFVAAALLCLLPALGNEGQELRPLLWTVSVVATAGQNFLRTFDTSRDKGFSEMGTVAVEEFLEHAGLRKNTGIRDESAGRERL